MSSTCPWCHSGLDKAFVRNLGRLPEPCPVCGKPLRESFYQVLFSVILSLPLAALSLYLSKLVFDSGSRVGAVIVVLAGIAVWAYLYRYIPTIAGPARGPGGHDP